MWLRTQCGKTIPERSQDLLVWRTNQRPACASETCSIRNCASLDRVLHRSKRKSNALRHTVWERQLLLSRANKQEADAGKIKDGPALCGVSLPFWRMLGRVSMPSQTHLGRCQGLPSQCMSTARLFEIWKLEMQFARSVASERSRTAWWALGAPGPPPSCWQLLAKEMELYGTFWDVPPYSHRGL